MLRIEPSGEHVEGFSQGKPECFSIQRAVQTHDFEDSVLFRVIRGRALVLERLREFKHFAGEFGGFVVGTVHDIQLQLDG
ncbi:MAG: hypothetical protein IT438_04315 [Phycisphaerales bacterium]|nr:hypothetical protein [Phycisphaerales bacterium]